ncbi:hypothetical protein D5777_25090 [Salmonella enterica subsp. enterica serovar Kottbus]|nr:hypothetical protein [Salmonella enterica subsp. enterica serovar Kottbus]EBY6716610.1 hypothetical protein [Salmonella enterica subsp. enterica serovar Kottbus]EBZ6410159.1 hypothetical protein [Salmonella enterica subsp. enterica serovar Kottbus]ECB3489068.1 hypothetical protein [Salmonella enterica subsp. enterica serovar Kottbus]EDL0059939.1 hypothetical protein [Salmonella enterica subsp. enterica serovar Kottbus]
MTTQLAFHETKFSVVNHNNQIWLASAELAAALQYSNVRAVTGLYNRYKDEFTESMSLVLKMNTKGFGGGNSEKDVRIFSLRGAHLVAMLSKTPVAKEFRRWVLDILDNEAKKQPVLARQPCPAIPFPKEQRFIVTVSPDGIADTQPLPDDVFVGKVSSILSDLRQMGWIVIKRDRLVETLATW